jgi:hypothetical protein
LESLNAQNFQNLAQLGIHAKADLKQDFSATDDCDLFMLVNIQIVLDCIR